MSKVNTQESLSQLTPAKLVNLYKKTLGDAANEKATPEEMIAAILAEESKEWDGEQGDTNTPAPEKPAANEKATPEALKFGNSDKEKKYDISKLKVPKDHYVVRHYSEVALANGQKIEDPTTSRFQVYDISTYNDMSKQGVSNGKQTPSKFEKLGLNVQVLHDPTK